MAKYEDQFAALLEKRILRGDYELVDLPTEQELADEVGISRMTARKSLLHLMEKGIILRQPHGRLQVNRRHEQMGGRPVIGLLLPTFHSMQYEIWLHAAEQEAEETGAQLRVVHYTHWNAPVISQALETFDGVLLVPSSETLPATTLERFRTAGNLVVLDSDLSKWGIPSLHASQKMLVHGIGNHLRGLGHRRIDCLNTQPHDSSILARLAAWNDWKTSKGVDGANLDEPVAAYGNPTAQAYRLLKQRLATRRLEATALFCLTSAAQGAVRALHESGYRIPADISVATVDGARSSRYWIPSCTAYEHQDLRPALRGTLDWMIQGCHAWPGPLLQELTNLTLFIGESTGPAAGDGLPKNS